MCNKPSIWMDVKKFCSLDIGSKKCGLIAYATSNKISTPIYTPTPTPINGFILQHANNSLQN